MPVSDKKREYASKMKSLLQDNRSVLIVGCDNVGSKQMQVLPHPALPLQFAVYSQECVICSRFVCPCVARRRF